MDFKIPCVEQFIFSSCHLLFHFPSLCLCCSLFRTTEHNLYSEHTFLYLSLPHEISRLWGCTLDVYKTHLCVCARVWNCLRCVPCNTKCAMREAVKTNGLTAVSIDLGGTTHVTLNLLRRESSHIALSLTAMSVKSFGVQPSWWSSGKWLMTILC